MAEAEAIRNAEAILNATLFPPEPLALESVPETNPGMWFFRYHFRGQNCVHSIHGLFLISRRSRQGQSSASPASSLRGPDGP